MPEHWEVRRIKTLFREKDERSGSNSGLLLSLTRAKGIVPQAEASTRIASAEVLSKYKVCRPGDLVMNRMQAWSGMFGLSTYDRNQLTIDSRVSIHAAFWKCCDELHA
jgi:type I restriction enzyme, S subunit